jgi:hypothetical protein
MTCPTVIRVTTGTGPPGIGLPAGTADAGKFVRKAGTTPYAYELVSQEQVNNLGTAASRDVPATGDASATQVVLGSDGRLGNAREWSAATATQAQAESGTSTSRLAFTPLRVFQAIAAWWQANSSAVGRALATAATQEDGRTALGLGSAATAASTDFVAPATLATSLAAKADLVAGVVPTSQIPAIAISDYLGAVDSQSAMLALTGQRGDWCLRTDTGAVGQWILSGDTASSLGNWVQITVPAAPVQSVNGQTGVIVLGASDVGALPSGALAAPGPIGGTTAAAGSFTALGASSSLLLPAAAPGTPAAGNVYRVVNQLRYRDSTSTEQVLLYGGGNLANLADAATARSNLSAIGTVITGITGAAQITNVISLSQTNYDAISTPSANTLYIITS